MPNTLAHNSAHVELQTSKPKFLDQFDQRRRSLVANMFFSSIRGGRRHLKDILMDVARDAGSRNAIDILQALTADNEGARAFAESCLAWDALSPEEKERRKAARRAEFRQTAVAERPVTDKQRAFLRKLGHQGDVANRLEASQLIDQLLAKRSA